jgi:hypothetical protein
MTQQSSLRVTLLDEIFTPGNPQLGIIRSRDQDFLQFLLWFEDAVLVDIAASKEAVMHHA